VRIRSQAQWNLFAPPSRAEFNGAERERAIALLKALLTEAVMTPIKGTPTFAEKEVRDEQDHV
jgi:hypothetical protein